MSLQKIPLVLSVVILTIAGTAATLFVHAQSGTTVTKTFAGSAIFQYGDAGGSAETSVIIRQKVIHLRNTGSHPDTFRTTLPVNPETRCGLRGPSSSTPENVLPNTLPAMLDIPLAVNETQYIIAMCVTKGLPIGPFTWSYKTVSVGALEAGSEKVIAEVQDTVNITEPIPCNDADGGMNKDVKGIATGTYSGARPGYVAIYGQEPNPSVPKTTAEKFSTYIDYCATSTQLNEGFCGTDGRLNAIGISCANGCKDGVCVAPPSSSSSVSSLPTSFLSSSSMLSSLSPRSASASTLSMSSLSTSSTAVPAVPAIPPSGFIPSIPVAGPPSGVPSVPSVPPAGAMYPSAPRTSTGGQVRPPFSREEKRLSASEVRREMQLLKSRGKNIQGKIRKIDKSIASLEKKIDGKLRLLDRSRNKEVQKRVNAQIDRWEEKIASLDGQKEGLEGVLNGLLESFERLKALAE